ncbi:conserved Plasmodium protein, unknown function [Plasmodium ovale wallikeri]|uniref:C6H2-type domain-containing protein n=2 Tax=Plasmodium ovale TaxID=36330 RepID=A0A1A8ZNM6_PLAOA|nr:conserved Plasmodium protein, unknown function [Plasmodium ovale wallikeri]SBT45490.1 conserved Plasmodium protein, unknown function [Plasmodium ovale wallikeri]SBT78758.1 HP12 protein homolog, putative [Plasmodium ovale]
MTVCSGCGVVTEVTICCPICLRHNKEVFYCSQECFEKNYTEHKKIHYFMKIISSEEMHSKMYEESTDTANKNLPVIILADNNGNPDNGEEAGCAVDTHRNPNDCKESSDAIRGYTPGGTVDETNGRIYDIASGGGDQPGDEMMTILQGRDSNWKGVQNCAHSCAQSNVDGRVTLHDDGGNYHSNACSNMEFGKNGKNGTFENFHRKKNYNKYKNGKSDYSLDDANEDKSKDNSYKGTLKKSKLSSYLSTVTNYIFSSKYNMILPYYQDMPVTYDKIGSKNVKIKNKISDKKMMELKKQLKRKKIFQLTILLIIISAIVILATCIFSYILETSQKNIQINSENVLNKNHTNRNLDIVELKSYISVIEELRKEIYEMKEVLYMHNIHINKNFHLNNTYGIFNNFYKTKPNAASALNKKAADKSGTLTSHSFYHNSSNTSTDNYSNNEHGEDGKGGEGGEEPGLNHIALTQHHYDVNYIHGLNNLYDDMGQNKDEPIVQEGGGDKLSQIRSVSRKFSDKEEEDTQNESNSEGIKKIDTPDISPTNVEDIENMLQEKMGEQNGNIFSKENQFVKENMNNVIKNHNGSNEYEQAKISNVIVNEEKMVNPQNAILDNGKEIADTNPGQNENLIYNHDVKEKHKRHSKVEDSDGTDVERKSATNKMNKKKQNTI